jgi:kynurenine formamidase
MLSRRYLGISVFAVLLLSTACQTAGDAPTSSAQPAFDLGRYRIVDLSHTFDDETIYWPTDEPFHHDQKAWGVTEGGYWYSSFTYGGSEHGGTHLDAPIHFAEGKHSVDQIPIEQLIGEAVVIDIADHCDQNPDYMLAATDIEAHEAKHGIIPAAALVLVKTGWAGRWPDKKAYMGSDVAGDVANLHFPGVSREAAELLAARSVAAVGIDTASIDPGVSRDFPTHQVLGAAEIAILENVASLDEVPERGALLVALPMKIGGGSGGPCRVVALIPRANAE